MTRGWDGTMQIAAQLYIFSKQPDQDQRIEKTLEALAGAGYQAIEGMYRLPPQDPGVVKRYGLQYFAPHLTPKDLNPLAESVSFCCAMGATHICSSGLLEWNNRSADDYRRSAEALSELGLKLRSEGIQLLYHNHEFEFEKVDGEKTGMGLLLEHLDFGAVRLCLDLGWLWIAGVDPVRFLRDHGAQIGMVHLRDFRGKRSVSLGRGDMDLPAVLGEIQRLPRLDAFAVEQDPTTVDPLGDMLASKRFLDGLL